jgi:hypothetical protein
MASGGARRGLLGLRVILTVVLAAGCTPVSVYARPIATLQQGFTAAAPAVREVYTGLNELQRDAYFTRLGCDPSSELVETDIEGHPTPLAHDAFSAESIQARVDAVELLGRYVDRLAALASADAAAETRLSEAGVALGGNLARLGARFASLPDDTAASYATPVGEVAAAVTRAVQGQRQAAAVRGAILDAATPVRRVLELLEADLDEVTATVRAPTLDGVIARCAAQYNGSRARWSDGERREALAAVRALVARRSAMRAQDPAALVRAMRDAHEALVRFVRAGSRDGREATELANAVAAFTRRVEAVAASVGDGNGERSCGR